MNHYNLEKLAYKRQLAGAGLGALLGAGASYGASRYSDDDNRLRNTLLGAGAGGLLGAGIGHLAGGRGQRAPSTKPRAGGGAPVSRRLDRPWSPIRPSRGPILVNGNAPPKPKVVGTAAGNKKSLSAAEIEARMFSPEAIAKREERRVARAATNVGGDLGSVPRVGTNFRLGVRRGALQGSKNLTPEQLQQFSTDTRLNPTFRNTAKLRLRQLGAGAAAAAPTPSVVGTAAGPAMRSRVPMLRAGGASRAPVSPIAPTAAVKKNR